MHCTQSVVVIYIIVILGLLVNFPQCFYVILYPSHPLTSVQNFKEIVPGEPLCQGLNAKSVARYSDFGHVEGYISETVQDTASGTIND